MSTFKTYADVVSLQGKCFLGHIPTWNVSEYFIIAAVPFDGKQLLILQGKGTVELNVVASEDSVRDVHFQVAQATGRNWKKRIYGKLISFGSRSN